MAGCECVVSAMCVSNACVHCSPVVVTVMLRVPAVARRHKGEPHSSLLQPACYQRE